MAKIVFFAGTDTDVGKTYVSALVAKTLYHSGVHVGVYKPVASGCREIASNGREPRGQRVSDDAVQLWQAAGKPGQQQWVCPQMFLAALAPNIAAAAEQKSVDVDQFTKGLQVWLDNCDTVIVEGAGGLMSPLADGVLNIDFYLGLPEAKLIIVAANRLGAIHQTLATCAAAESRGATPSGIILSTVAPESDDSIGKNAAEIATFTNVPILGQIRYGGDELPFDVARIFGDGSDSP